jgi:hypothetical protein
MSLSTRLHAGHFTPLAVDDFYASTQDLHATASFLRSQYSPSASREISRIFWIPTVHYFVLKIPSLVTVLRRRTQSTPPIHFLDVNYNITLSSTHSKNRSKSEALCNISTPKLEENPLSTVCHGVFNIFPATLHI